MKIELFPFPASGTSVRLPRLLVSIRRTRKGDRPFFTIGRLYRGYVGAYWITRLFTFTLWIALMEK